MPNKCRAAIAPNFPLIVEALHRQGFFCSAIFPWAQRSAFAVTCAL